jgi:excisionase family DNA binding protein
MPDSGDTQAGGDRMLSVEEVAERMGVVPETVRRLLRDKQLAGWRLGRKAGWRIKERDLDAFITSRMNRPEQHDA